MTIEKVFMVGSANLSIDHVIKMAASKEALLFCFLFVLLCGDVEENPGPGTRYPCSLCYQPVRWNQKALLCDLY